MLPSRLVGGGRTLKQATTALTNKANKKWKEGGGLGWAGLSGNYALEVAGVEACQERLNCHTRWTAFVGDIYFAYPAGKEPAENM